MTATFHSPKTAHHLAYPLLPSVFSVPPCFNLPPAALKSTYPMAKAKTQFLCNSCGSVHPKWMGKCPDCGTWDSLQEYKEPTFDARAERTAATRSATGDIT